MSYTTLITVDQLDALRASGAPVVLLDCGFDLTNPAAGRAAFEQGHLPGARYVHLDDDLAGPMHPEGPRSPQFTGRHPLPDREAFAARVGAWGIGPETQVVVYDNHGLIYAARAWWMLRWLGHSTTAVLDGGRAAWVARHGSLEAGIPASAPRAPYPLSPQPSMPVIEADALLADLGRVRVLDARTVERRRGDVEPLDPVGGHIPGSTARFFKDNLQPDGFFKPAEQLRAEFQALGVRPDDETVQQCGSGVTACHNLLAQLHAGLGVSRLYVGSWSEWCADPRRPVAKG